MNEVALKRNKKIKVLHLIDSGGLYGAEKMLLALCEEQRKQGIESSILSCGELGESEKPIEVEAKKLGLDVITWRMKSGLNALGMLKILRFAKTRDANLLHSHGYKFNILLALIPKSFRPFKLLTSVHGYVQAKTFSAMWLYEVLDRVALRRFDKVVLVSEKMKEIPALNRLNQAKVNVIGNGIPRDYSKVSLVNELLVFRRKFKTCLVAVGRLSPEKGFLDLLEALSIVFKSETYLKNNIGLVIFGEGGLKREILHCIDALELNDNVHLAGYYDDAGAYLANFDALVMPSLTEGLPITLLEAMRARLPVVASKVGGIPHVLSSESAYLVDAQDISALAKNIAYIAENSSDAQNKASKAYERFLSSYSSQLMNDHYAKAYDELLEPQNGRREASNA